MVLVMRDVTAERQLWEQLRQADYDALTGLPNRAHFERRLDGSGEREVGVGTLFSPTQVPRRLHDLHLQSRSCLMTGSSRGGEAEWAT
jgi:hypothetical protein